jgi:hypothetical protein
METYKNTFSPLTKFIFFVSLGLTLFFLYVFGSFSFVGSAFAGLIVLVLVVIFLTYLVIGLATRGRYPFKVAIYLLIVIVSSTVSGNIVNDYFRKQSFAKAEEVIGALETYYNEKSYYPEGLDRLVPMYIEELPRPWFGLNEGRYTYKKRGEYYSLSFPLPAWMLAMYDSKKKGWTIND